MALLLRKILEEASDIKEAIAIIKRHQVMVAEAILIADGKVPEAAVLELSPKMVVVRRASNNLIGVANHLLDSKYSGDASNNWLRRYTTSEARYQRVMELLRRYRGRLDIRTAAMILRNRAGLNDQPLALGNRNAIDALIATHGVLLDLDDMILWVSKGPHLLGAFTPIDLKPLFAIPTNSIPSQPETIPPDPLLDSPELKRHQHVQLQLELARQFEKMGEMVQALALAQQAAQLEPESPDAQLLAGDLLWEENEKEEAKQYYQNYLKLFPPYLRDKERVMIRLNR
jgi:tetratricopeptide (TPR) repeat protein